MFWKLMVWCGLLLALTSCGGGSTSSTVSSGPEASDAPVPYSGYGTPQDNAQVQRMAKRLSAYFGSEKATLTDSTIVASSSEQKSARDSTASLSDKSLQQKELPPSLRPHRFFNTATGVHFYTISDQEKREIEQSLPQFSYEGRAYRVLFGPANFAVPVYRFYNRVAGTHLYTASESEKNTVIQELSDIYNFEGEAWFARPGPYPGWVPVYRFFNRLTGTHFYTHDEGERANVLATLPHYALEGVAYWVRSEDTAVDPQTWQPPAGATPSLGNYVYFESQAGDFVGLGEQHLWTATNSRIQMINRYDKILELEGEGTSKVGAKLFFPSTLSDWKPGFYPNATRLHWIQSTGPGLDFSMGGRGCNETSGWIYIDSVSHDPDGTLSAFELRFEQLCQWSTDFLRGKVRWSKYDTVMPPGPVVPAPDNLWRPAPGVVPSSGSFAYLEGNTVRYWEDASGVWHEQPHSYSRLIRGADSTTGQLGFAGNGNVFGGVIGETTSNETLQFAFQSMWFTPKLVPGLYRDVTLTPSPNPARGNLDFYYAKYSNPQELWSCQWSNGWFVVDEVSYAGDAVSSIQIRFERSCLDSPQVTRGMIRWQSGD